MSLLWMAIVGGCAIAIAVVTSWRRRVDLKELGTVSEHWLAEQRAIERHYPSR